MSWDRDDDIGYGRPPTWTRFTKGRSGNPHGRPRKLTPETRSAPAASEHDDILRRSLEQMVEINEGGRRRKVKLKEVVQRRQIQEAARGSVYAMTHALRASQELAERDRLRAAEEAGREDRLFAYMVDWRASQVRVWRAAAAEGREPQQPWPHPDDFFIDEVARRWDIRGPSRLEDVDIYEAMQADRDVHHMRYVIDVATDRVSMAAINGLFFLAYETMLPKRWCKDIEGLEAQAHEFLRYPLPLLEAALGSVERHALSFCRRPMPWPRKAVVR